MEEHNKHKSSTRTTYKLDDYALVYCEVVSDRIEARVLEKYLKSGAGREMREEVVK